MNYKGINKNTLFYQISHLGLLGMELTVRGGGTDYKPTLKGVTLNKYSTHRLIILILLVLFYKI